MTLYFSPSTGGFYDDAIHGARKVQDRNAAVVTLIDNPRCLIPADAVEISAERHVELMAAQASGKVIVAGEDGPDAIDPVVTIEQAIAQNRLARDRMLRDSDWTQLPDALLDALSYKASLAEWRQSLRDMNLRVGNFPAMPTKP